MLHPGSHCILLSVLLDNSCLLAPKCLHHNLHVGPMAVSRASWSTSYRPCRDVDGTLDTCALGEGNIIDPTRKTNYCYNLPYVGFVLHIRMGLTWHEIVLFAQH